MMPLLAHMSQAIMDASDFVGKNVRTKQPNQIKGVEAGMQTLAWVTMSPKPAPYIKETIGSAEFYINRVLKEFKESDAKQVAWARSYLALQNALYNYVKSNHTTGPSWNAAGGVAKAPAAPAGASAASAAPAAAKPSAAAVKPAAGGSDVKGALFSSLTKGEGVTAGLKKVDRSQMTHKNPELRASSVVKASEAATKRTTLPSPRAATAATKRPPVLELQGKKWVVVCCSLRV